MISPIENGDCSILQRGFEQQEFMFMCHHICKNYDLTNNNGDSMEMSLGQNGVYTVQPKFWRSNYKEMMVETSRAMPAMQVKWKMYSNTRRKYKKGLDGR